MPPPMQRVITPPSMPKPKRSEHRVGDRVKSEVDGVTFHERMIPAPPGGHVFMIMEKHVTQALYRVVMGQNSSEFSGDDLPVSRV